MSRDEQLTMIEIGGYDGFELIGRGGFATVHKARQISVGRDVAIKVLSDPSPDADLVRRFERESKAVGALSWHPHIAAVVDAGTTVQGQAYIAFELLTGGSLDERIERSPMPWDQAVAAMIQVADAVEAAHRADVLHRDIKPANILMSRLGDAKLADFGIASMQDGTKTETGVLAATVAHAAPELFDGVLANPSHDVYALGSTLYNLIAGHAPFSGSSEESIGAVIKRIATLPPPVLDPALAPTGVAETIWQALAKQPELRHRSAAAFGQALQSVQAGLGISVTPMPVGDQDEPVQTAAPHAPATIAQQPIAELQQHAAASQAPAAPAYGAPTPYVSNPHVSNPHVSNPHVSNPHVSNPQVSNPQLAVPHEPSRRRGPGLFTWLLLLALAGGAAAATVVFWPQTEPLAITAGGARIIDADALDATTIPENDSANAIDNDPTTYWGVRPNVAAQRNIVGTTYSLRFDEPIRIDRVGIDNGAAENFGRVSTVVWATTIAELNEQAASNVTQVLPDAPGQHYANLGITTDRLVLLVAGVHDGDTGNVGNVGIAEILVDVDE